MNKIRNTIKTKLISVIFCICIILSSCTNKPSETIRIGILDGPSAISFIQMIEKPPVVGGQKIQIIVKSEPIQIQALMMQGKLDFAILPTVMAANLYNKGLKYRMLACPIWGTLYLLTNGKEQNLNDLKGKVISVFGQGATADILLQRKLKRNGISNVEIDYSYTTNQEVAKALLYKKTEWAVVSEPMVSNLLALDSSIHIVSKIDCEEYIDELKKDIFVQTSFMVSERFTMDNPTLVEQVCHAYTHSCNFTNEQPDSTAKLLVKHKISPNIAVAKQSIPLCNIHFVSAYALEEEVNKYLKIFYDYHPKSIGGKLPDSNFIFQTY
ncbi:MAG: ABC transporter substrate-binding protein [Paludibacter sp.]